jgi:hypothetical protein
MPFSTKNLETSITIHIKGVDLGDDHVSVVHSKFVKAGNRKR